MSFSKTTSSREDIENESGRDLFTRLLSQKTNPQTSFHDNNEKISPQNPSNTQANPAIISQLEKILLISKPLNLDQTILPNPIANRDIIEICGRVGVGKSELLMHFMSRCLFPARWRIPKKRNTDRNCLHCTKLIKEVDLSRYSCYEQIELGQVPKVLLIQTDAKLNIARLSSIMEARVSRVLVDRGFSAGDKTTEVLVKKFVRECLKSLVVYECFNREQFLLSIAALEPYIQSLLLSPDCSQVQKTSFIPIFIDSINSNFEVFDRYESSLGLCDYDHTEKYAVQLVRRLCSKYNVFIVATRSDLSIFTTNERIVGYKKWQALANVRIELEVKTNLVDDLMNEDDCDIGCKKIEMKPTIKVINTKECKSMEVVKSVMFSIDEFGFRIHS